MEQKQPGTSYYAIGFRLDGQERFFIWCSDDAGSLVPDRALIDDDNALLTFRSLNDLSRHVGSIGFEVAAESDPLQLDLDAFEAWCTQPDTADIDCNKFLRAWNMFDDILTTLGRPKLLFDGQDSFDNGVYDGSSTERILRG